MARRVLTTAICVVINAAVASAQSAQSVPAAKAEGAPRAHGVAGDPPLADSASRILTCEGLFGPKATHAKMTEAFGPGNVTYDKQDDGAEGETYMATVLFKKVPGERLVITWADEKRQMKPDSVIAKVSAPVPGSNWRLANGVHAGSSLEEVEAANGKPFAMSGFDWDYGGYATDWKGGALAKLGPCNASIRFNPGKGAKTDKVSGDATFQSNDPKMKAAKPFVSNITVTRKPGYRP